MLRVVPLGTHLSTYLSTLWINRQSKTLEGIPASNHIVQVWLDNQSDLFPRSGLYPYVHHRFVFAKQLRTLERQR